MCALRSYEILVKMMIYAPITMGHVRGHDPFIPKSRESRPPPSGLTPISRLTSTEALS